VRAGASIEAVRLLAGHSALDVTQRYVHATGEDLRGALLRLDAIPSGVGCR
jgi:site-specific recombinase XerD